MSGQTINLEKSKVFVFPDVQRIKARRISDLCGIKLTNNLGKYLGVPLLHKRLSKQDFNHIIEKFKIEWLGWFLTPSCYQLVYRTTLAQSVTSTIPSYTMQTMHLSASICERRDRLNINFLWGDSPGNKKMHFVKWDKVCKKAKDIGGLGLKKPKTKTWLENFRPRSKRKVFGFLS